jgi:hypothetical protein
MRRNDRRIIADSALFYQQYFKFLAWIYCGASSTRTPAIPPLDQRLFGGVPGLRFTLLFQYVARDPGEAAACCRASHAASASR